MGECDQQGFGPKHFHVLSPHHLADDDGDDQQRQQCADAAAGQPQGWSKLG